MQRALEKYLSGNKGALTYALKMITFDDINSENVIEMVNYLINIMLIRPDLSKICMGLLAGKIERLTIIKKTILSEIKNAIESQKQQELMWGIYTIIVFKICIPVEIIEKVLSQFSNDFTIIMVLDIIKNKQELIIGKNKQEILNKALICLAEKMTNTNYYSDHWLLMYENYYNKFISTKILNYSRIYGNKNDNMYKFFRVLRSNKVNFYESNSFMPSETLFIE